MIIDLIVGDWSGDGHDNIEIISIESNFTTAQINQSYLIGSEILGLDFCKTVCTQYEDDTLPFDIYQKFEECGFGYTKWNIEDYEYETYSYCVTNKKHLDITPNIFTQLYLFVVKLGDSNFQYSFVENNTRINIGGYGLFE